MYKAIAIALAFLLSQGLGAAAWADGRPTQRELLDLWKKLKEGTVDISAELRRLSTRANERTDRPGSMPLANACPARSWPPPEAFRQLLQILKDSDAPFDQVEIRLHDLAAWHVHAAHFLCDAIEKQRIYAPRSPPPPDSATDALWRTALVALDAGDFAAAEAALAGVEQSPPMWNREVRRVQSLQVRGFLASIRGDELASAAHFEAALALMPENWKVDRWAAREARARALAWHGRDKKDKGTLLRAIDIYRAWLNERGDDERWVQAGLGYALSVLSELEEEKPEAMARAEEAVATYRQALKAAPKENDYLFESAQIDLAHALWRRGKLGREPWSLREAMGLVQEMLASGKRTRRSKPELRSALAQLRSALGKWEGNAVLLGQALDSYRSVLPQWPRETSPLDWASIQQSVGDALVGLGETGPETEPLEQAITAYRLALEELTRERVPQRWAMLQHDLGLALMLLGERQGSAALLEEAAVAVRLSLQEVTRERNETEWARAQSDLARVLSLLAGMQR